ncbi:MAG: MiaB/RimO family radical SAM methylthiotransferase, partial [Deltaproteobacteria bacterium]|nr:MiaB/RimO family radical SAM methylthiotransferase [Deltaproteobacteria bacterium]
MKFRILTMGCKVNQVESAAMAERLREAGHVPCGASEPSLVVLNTCCVTGAAEKEAFRILRRLRREHPGARVVAAGCLAQLAPERLLDGGAADLALGNSWKSGVAEMAGDGGLPSRALVEGGPDAGFAWPAPGPSPGRSRAFVKIQDGCSRSCSYCVIPSVRGPSRSLAPEGVLAALKAVSGRGAAEAVLTGIHLGAWGRDLSPRRDLAWLLREISSGLAPDPLRFRLRLSSLEPGEALRLAEAFRSLPFLAPHLHLPLQAGSDRVLSAMGRPYTLARYREAAESFARDVPGISIGADLIAGFPGETEDEHLETLDLVRALPLAYLHVFPFSERPGARAASFPGRIPTEERARRVSGLRAVDREMRARFLADSLGREHLA